LIGTEYDSKTTSERRNRPTGAFLARRPILFDSQLDFSLSYRNTWLVVISLKSYFKKLLKFRVTIHYFVALIRNTPARSMAQEMIVFNISRDIVKLIIHQLLLHYDPDDSAADDNRTTENVKDNFF
jgi:hypothetical protein